MLSGKRVLLIIGGGIAAYKSLCLIRLLRGQGCAVTPVLTQAGAQFVTPLSVSALAGQKVHSALFDLTDESEMGHIELSRSADLIVVAPATAGLMAKGETLGILTEFNESFDQLFRRRETARAFSSFMLNSASGSKLVPQS